MLAGDDGWNPAGAASVHLVLVGDSTVNDHSGWGAGFRHFVTAGALVTNTAQNGRSSKSFRAEGHWDKALALKGDYYLIQFGHNDQPGKGPERETDPATTYAENMARYVDEVRAIGGRPILITSLTRRNFAKADLAKIDSTLTPYVEAVKKIATEKNVPLLDLHQLSLDYCERIGPAETAKLNPSKEDGTPDTTHLGPTGSLVFGRIVAGELRRVVPELAPVLRAEPDTAVFNDLTYGSGRRPKSVLRLDARVPAGTGPFPPPPPPPPPPPAIVILIHGGGWGRGDQARH